MAPAGIGDRVEGLHAVAAAVGAGRVRTLTIESQRLRHDEYGELVSAAEASGATVRRVDDTRDLAVTGTPQGVIAECVPVTPMPLEAAISAASPTALLVLDRVQDPRNVGAIA